MDNPHEILVAYKDDPEVRLISFSELHAVVDKISSLIFLWDTNSYCVNCVSRTFILNGGRVIHAEKLQDCSILYRKRSKLEISISGEGSWSKTVWIIGLQAATGDMTFIKISEDGKTWEWGTAL